jgi:hypothetical protein
VGEYTSQITHNGPWPLEVVDLVWTPSGAQVAAIVNVRATVLHPV